MTTPLPRTGNAMRAVLLLVFILLAVPTLLISIAFLGYRATAARADELQRAEAAHARAEQAVAEHAAAERAKADRILRSADARAQVSIPAKSIQASQKSKNTFQPVSDTEYRTEIYEVQVPAVNPATGKVEVNTTVQSRVVPVVRNRYVQAFVVPDPQDPSVRRLTEELRAADEKDDSYERKLKELRQRLELEFSSMHESQAKEIDRAAERLESLKKLHQQRGENRDKIVQRRIDELLGRTDALQWEINPTPPFGHDNAYSNQNAPHWVNPAPAIAGTDSLPRDPSDPNLPKVWTPRSTPWPVPMMQAPRNIAPPAAPIAPVPPSKSRAATKSSDHAPVLIDESETRVSSDDPNSASQADASSGIVSRIFQVARSTGAARSALRMAELDVERMQKLRQRGGVPVAELQKAEANLEQIKREFELSQLELEALGESINRTQRFAESQFENAAMALELARKRFEQGTAPTEQLIRVEQALSNAREVLEQAAANLEQLEKAKSLLRRDAKEKAEKDDDAFESAREALKEDYRRDKESDADIRRREDSDRDDDTQSPSEDAVDIEIHAGKDLDSDIEPTTDASKDDDAIVDPVAP